MKAKNVKLSFLVLAGLIILSYAFLSSAQEKSNTSNNIFIDSDQDGLSDQEEQAYGTDPRNADSDSDGYSDGAEVKSGYDPLKPSPGDKIVNAETTGKTQDGTTAAEATGDNMTKQLAQKISTIVDTGDSASQEISLEQVKTMVDDTLNQSFSSEELPQISKDDIKIKKQSYANLSADRQKTMRQEDFMNYLVTTYYILASNSPKPITASSDINTIFNSTLQNIVLSLETGDASSIQMLSASGEKMAEQLKTMEVPADMVDTHIKGLQFAEYATSIQNAVKPNTSDPMAQIANLSKIKAFLGALTEFSAEIGTKFAEYGVEYDDTLKNKINTLGVPAPDLDSLQVDQMATGNSSDALIDNSDSDADVTQ